MVFNMHRGEVRALVVVLAAAAIAGGGWLVWRGASDFELAQQKGSYAAFQETNASGYRQGDTITADSQADENTANEAGWPYAAGFDWKGTMEWTVLDSWLYDTPADAGISGTSPGTYAAMPDFIAQSGDYRFLLCEVRVKNNDAVPKDAEAHFNISTFSTGTLGYFDGTISGGSDKDGWKYDLAPGDTAVYRVGFYVLNPDDHPESLLASLGNASTDVKKVTIQLEPHDERSNAQ